MKNVMEIMAPRGSMRLEAFPTFEEYKPNYHSECVWRHFTNKQKLERYSEHRNRCLIQQAQCVKAFMKQHKRRNGHNREAV